MISVAVCDHPAGKYEFYGYVKYADGTPIGKKGEPFQFDPGIFKDDDGRLYLYTGFALASNPILLDGSKPTEHGPMCFELDPDDMLTDQVLIISELQEKKKRPVRLMKDIRFWKPVLCGSLAIRIILFTVP